MRSAYRRILRYAPRYRVLLAAGGLCVLLSRLLMVYAPRLLGEALNALEQGGEDGVATAVHRGWTFFAVSLVAALFAVGMALLHIVEFSAQPRVLVENLPGELSTALEDGEHGFAAFAPVVLVCFAH